MELLIKSDTPILLKRLRKKRKITGPFASEHRTAATTQGHQAEMGDQEEDATRYDQD